LGAPARAQVKRQRRRGDRVWGGDVPPATGDEVGLYQNGELCIWVAISHRLAARFSERVELILRYSEQLQLLPDV